MNDNDVFAAVVKLLESRSSAERADWIIRLLDALDSISDETSLDLIERLDEREQRALFPTSKGLDR